MADVERGAFTGSEVERLSAAGLNMAPGPMPRGVREKHPTWLGVIAPREKGDILLLRTDRLHLIETISREWEGDPKTMRPNTTPYVMVQGKTANKDAVETAIATGRDLLEAGNEQGAETSPYLEVAVRLGDLTLGQLEDVRFAFRLGEQTLPVEAQYSELPAWVNPSAHAVPVFELHAPRTQNVPGTTA